MKNEFVMAITQLAAEKNLPRDVVFEAVEAALASAFKKEVNSVANISVKIDRDSGNPTVFLHKNIVEEVTNPRDEIALADARKIQPDVELGDTLPFEQPNVNAGRIAAQTAKQVVLQRLREAEREVIFDEYHGKEGELITGLVQRVEGRQAIIDVGRAEAVLPMSEQPRGDHVRPGQRTKVYVLEVKKESKGPQIVVSRTHKNLIRRLFELEVPEIHRGTVEIKSIAREAGSRTKIAVYSRQQGVDPIGSCVGLRGVRIQNIVNELNGERIDVVLWDPDPAKFVQHALSPARVVAVTVNEDTNTATAIVPDLQLSLAIGKEGQNARLTARLTGLRIDIKAESVAMAAPGEAPEHAPETVFSAPAPAPEDVDAGARIPVQAPVLVPVVAETAPVETDVAEVVEPVEEELAPAALAEPVTPPVEEETPAVEWLPEPEPVLAAPAPPRTGGIRFAEDLGVTPRIAPLAPDRARGGSGRGRGGRDETEEEAARRRAAARRGGRRDTFVDEEDDDDPYAEYAQKFR